MTILFVGTANHDTTARVARAPGPGQTVVASASRVDAGGKAANQAAAAARLGARAILIATVGEDAAGTTLIDALDGAGVDTSAIRRTAFLPTGSAFIVVDENAENEIVVITGANGDLTPDDVNRGWPTIPDITVSVALEGPVAPITAAVDRAVAEGHRVVINLSPVTDAATHLLPAADPLVVNEHEARSLAGKDSATLEELAEALAAKGARSVVITAGARGAVALSAGTPPMLIPGEIVQAVDTTGAGDAFTGALCAGLDRGASLIDAVRTACRVAAYSVQRPGAQSSYPSAEDLHDESA